jgi:ABC-type branched-subunit amino acid transport system ATPase component
MSVLDVVGLEVRYGGRLAVNSLSFSVQAGRVLGLIGPNGAGKSSALAAIGGQVRASAGTVTLAGTRIDAVAPWRRARLGLGRSFQCASVFSGLTVAQDVGLGLEVARLWTPRRGRAESVSATLAAFGLEAMADRPTESLALGDRRRVELARCLVSGRRVLLLDEPSCNLDASERDDLGDAIEKATRTGLAIVLVDHDLGLVDRVCDEVLVLDRGQTLWAGTPAALGSNSAVRAAFLGDGLDAA